MKYPPLFITFHGKRLGATFDQLEKAQGYPGPRGLECAEKEVVAYVSGFDLVELVNEWIERAEDLSGEFQVGARTELTAAIGDLSDLLKKAGYLESE